MLTGKVLITGGSGFLGRAIMRRAQDDSWPCEIIVYSRDELKQSIARRKYNARYVLGDIRDDERMYLAMLGVDIVIHTAALKYVPEAEHNAQECISVNISGTQAVLAAARRAGVRRVVFVSTDKAVSPMNVYGMTKALGERIVGELGCVGDTTVTAVRYGNVVGSTGSVIPEFIRQAAETGQIRVTHPGMTRFWLSADEAIDLIICAVSAEPGTVTIPNARALSLSDLIAYIAPKAGVICTGLRDGEKMHETLLTRDESRWVQVDTGEGYGRIFVLPPLCERRRPELHTFDITSDAADGIPRDVFLGMVADAAEV
jgi:UDP-N-acetylglucosamine 4,6-dehydratase